MAVTLTLLTLDGCSAVIGQVSSSGTTSEADTAVSEKGLVLFEGLTSESSAAREMVRLLMERG